jgi:hypothetical protein
MTKPVEPIQTMLQTYPNFKGSKVIDLLYAHPDTPIPAADMELLLTYKFLLIS